MKQVLDHYKNSGEEVQIKLRNDFAAIPGIGGMGPGKITDTEFPEIYAIAQLAQMGEGQGSKMVTMRFMFSIDDVLWVSPAPEIAEESPIIVTPGANKGGFHVGQS